MLLRGLIIDKYQSHNTSSFIWNINTLVSEHRWCTPTVAREVVGQEFEFL
jgi:hypothetical protein